MSIAQQIMANPGRYSIQELQHAMYAGVVPAYVAIPLIQEKTQKQQQMQMAAAGQNAPQEGQPSVVDQVMAQAQQAQGVNSLQSNLPAQDYAPGGIVAFDHGGEVPHFDGTDGSYVDEYASMYNAPENTGEYSTPFTPPRGVVRFFQTLNPFESEESKARRAREDKRMYVPPPGYDKNGKPVSPAAQISAQAAASAPTPAPVPASASGPAPASGIDKLPAAPSIPNISTALGRATNLYTPDVIRKLEDSRKPIYLDESKYVPKELTVPEAAKQVKDVQAAFGVSEKPYEEQASRLEKRGKDLEARKAQSKWEALVAAGLGAMGTKSRYLAQGISEGGLRGLQQYTEAREKLDASQEKLDAAQFALADAQNRFRQEGSKEAAAELRNNRHEVQAAKRDVARDKVTADRQAQVFARDDVKSSINEAARVQGQNLQLRAQEVGLELQKAGLNLQQFNARTQRMLAERPDLLSTALGFLNKDPEFQNAAGKKKAEMLTDALSNAKAAGTSTLEAKKIAARIKVDENKTMDPVWAAANKKKDVDAMRKREAEMANYYIYGTYNAPNISAATSQTDPLGLGF